MLQRIYRKRYFQRLFDRERLFLAEKFAKNELNINQIFSNKILKGLKQITRIDVDYLIH
jgi:hypothetical protein